jgi:Arc/MetJ-type ribon-helix-helix transcriptional regulator
MGILTKPEKKTKAVMVRVPVNLMVVVDAMVGGQYTSRPDFIVEAIRCYTNTISSIETAAMIKVKDKDIAQAAKVAFYHEFLDISLTQDRNFHKGAEDRSGGKTIDVLLSILPGLIAEMNSVVERTKAFKSYQEFIKMAICHLITLTAARNSNTLLTSNFLHNAEDMKGLRDELDKLRETMGQ